MPAPRNRTTPGEMNNSERAAVTYPAPHGLDVLTIGECETVAFGRGVECEIRFGYAPQLDDQVPRLAGFLSVVHDRVLVEGSSTVGHKALEIRAGDGAPFRLPIGEGHSPRASQFDVMVPGSNTLWKLSVSVKHAKSEPDVTSAPDLPTNRVRFELTPTQWSVVAAYLEPVRRGRVEPATHAEVAAALGKHQNTVRAILYDVWSVLFREDIPMLDTADKRFAVVEAIRLHALMPP